jgi:exodeoxyribonuclease VII large subunit
MSIAEQRELFNDRPVYTLSDISKSLQSIISKTYNQPYYIKAEIIKLNYYPRTGHCYPELAEKEDEKIKAQMRAIIWSSQYKTINERFKKITGDIIKEGITILCLASIEYSPQYGLALHIQDIEPTFTLGEMAKSKIAVIERLKKEGIFNANKKMQLPLIPKRIAIISIETSKGYSDFMITLLQNNWNYKFDCQLFPAILQGEKAITTITEQLAVIKSRITEFDCVVIIRGGGGDVGLSCYDHYQLAREVAIFPIPVLSGIGHSTNETVTEMVAYANKITPTEVAYFLIQKFHDFSILIEDFQNFILKTATDRIKNDFINMEINTRLIKLFSKQIIEKQQTIIDNYIKQLELLHPENILKRGFSITYHKGKVITDSNSLQNEDLIVTQYYKGKTESIIKKST